MTNRLNNGGIKLVVKDTKKPVKRRKKRPNLKHGAYSYLSKANMYIMPTTQLHMCDPCPLKNHCDYYEPGASCKIIDTFTPARFNEIMAMDHVLPSQRGAAWSVIRLEVLCWLIDTYLGIFGTFVETDKGTDLQPILKSYGTYQNSLRLAYREMGLTPASMKDAMSLQKGGGSLASAILKAAAEEAEIIDTKD